MLADDITELPPPNKSLNSTLFTVLPHSWTPGELLENSSFFAIRNPGPWWGQVWVPAVLDKPSSGNTRHSLIQDARKERGGQDGNRQPLKIYTVLSSLRMDYCNRTSFFHSWRKEIWLDNESSAHIIYKRRCPLSRKDNHPSVRVINR